MELARHAIILAEGLTVESYLDIDGPVDFAGGSAIRPHPEDPLLRECVCVRETGGGARR